MKHRLRTSKYDRERNRQIKSARKREELERRSKYKDAAISDGFRKVKARFIAGAAVKSIICGLSAGLFAVGLIMLIVKLTATPFEIWYYVVAGAGCAVLCGAVTFLFFKPDNRKVAKTVDEEFGLNEQVQTSVAFSRMTGSIVEMQRERADETVRALPRRKIKFSRIWQYLVIIVIAAALAVTAFLVPAKKVEGGVVDPNNPTVSVNHTHSVRIKDIINNLQISALANENDAVYGNVPLAQAVLEELEALRVKLEDAETREEEIAMSEINGTLDRISALFAEETTYLAVAETIAGCAAAGSYEDYFSPIIKAGGDSYRTEPIYAVYKAVEDFLLECPNRTESYMSRRKSEMENWLFPASDDEEEETPAAVAEEPAEDPIVAAKAKLRDLRYLLLDADEQLAAGFLKEKIAAFGGALPAFYGDSAPENFEDEVTGAIDNFSTGIMEYLQGQSYSLAMERYIGNSIRDIFGLELIQPDAPEADPSTGPADGGEGDGGNGGGGGSGDFTYPSDDYLYDYQEDDLLFYGDLLRSKYERQIKDFLDKNGEELTEEQKKMIQDYIDALYGSSAEE